MSDNVKGTKIEGRVDINPSISPIYADDIVQFNFAKGVAKILLAQRFDENLTHTSTIALPLETLLLLRNLLNSEEFTKAIEELIGSKKP